MFQTLNVHTQIAQPSLEYCLITHCRQYFNKNEEVFLQETRLSGIDFGEKT